MNWLKQLFSRSRLYEDLSEEIREHLEERIEELVASGMSRKEATAAARREFGNLTLIQEDSRAVWQWPSIEELLSDTRYALRQLHKNPGFTAVVVLTLAFGIGAGTAIFSVVESVLWRPLPFPDSERLAAIWSTNLSQPSRKEAVSSAGYLDWRAQNTVFDAMAAFDWGESHTLTGNGGAVRLYAVTVSANYFETLRVPPLLGRAFRPEEEQTGKNRVALLSHTLWESHFRSDPTLIGRAITLDGQQYTVVGVCPSTFHLEFARDPDLYLPLALGATAATNRADRNLAVLGRLKRGVDFAQAGIEMTTIAQRLGQQYPKEDGHWGVRVENLRKSYTAYASSTNFLLFLLGAVALLFLIACTNVANLLLSRGLVRRREFAVRTVLGASRKVLMRQSLMESFALAVPAGVLGTLLARWGISIFSGLIPPGLPLPRGDYIRFDVWVFAFAVILSFATTILSGLLPALFASKVDINNYLKEGSRSIVTRSGEVRTRGLLVTAQVAIALVLLFGAGLFVNSFLRLAHVSLGFDPHNILTMRIDLKGRRYSSSEKVILFYQSLLERARALPGVHAAVAANQVPLTGAGRIRFVIAGQRQPSPGEEPWALNRVVTTDYFRVMNIRLLAGRNFDQGDAAAAPRVIIVNENFVRHFLASEEPLGKELDIRPGASDKAISNGPAQIVGIVANTKEVGLNEADFDDIYFPFPQNPNPSMFLVLSTDVPPGSVADPVRKQVLALDKDLPILSVVSMERRVADALRGDRLNLILIGSFAAFALLLASVGIYGAMSYSVEQSTQEFGIRMALGASHREILALALRRAAVLAFTGLSTGLAASLALGGILGNRLYLVPHQHTGLLYGVSLFDPLTLTVVLSFLTAAALFASYLPARRAMHVDPMVALRYE